MFSFYTKSAQLLFQLAVFGHQTTELSGSLNTRYMKYLKKSKTRKTYRQQPLEAWLTVSFVRFFVTYSLHIGFHVADNFLDLLCLCTLGKTATAPPFSDLCQSHLHVQYLYTVQTSDINCVLFVQKSKEIKK